MIAQELVAARPGRVAKLVLCCTHPGLAYGFSMPEVTLRLFAEVGSLDPAESLHRFVVNALGEHPAPALVDELYARRAANPPDDAGWRAQAAAGMTFAGVEETITAPTLVLTGTADNVVDPRNSEVLASRIPGARLEVFQGLGHLFFWEAPERFVRIVSEFLA
jgi:pimeloyl-ACP methyl ester carboxylesterase